MTPQPTVIAVATKTNETTSKAKKIQLILMVIVVLAYGTQLFAYLYDLIQALTTSWSDIPPILKTLGATVWLFYELKYNTVLTNLIMLAKILPKAVILVMIMKLGWIGQAYSMVEEYFSNSTPTRKAMAFMSLWSLVILLFSYTYMYISFDAFGAQTSLTGIDFSVLLQTAVQIILVVLWGAGVGFVFHRITKNTPPITAVLILFGLGLVFRTYGQIIGVWTAMASHKHVDSKVLTKELTDLLDKESFPSSRLYLWNNTSNAAYSSGIFFDMIQVGEELLKDPKTLCAVLAHELGHRRNLDIFKGIFLNEISRSLSHVIAIFVVLPNPVFYSAFKLTTEPIIGALPIASTIVSMIDPLVQASILWFGRNHEYAADDYAVQLGYGKELIKFHATVGGGILWKGSWLRELFNTHPYRLNRIERLGQKIGL